MQQFGSVLFAQVNRNAPDAAVAGVMMLVFLVEFALIAVMLAGMWGVFTKAGKPGWAAIIPVYNIIVLLEITDKPLWWIIMFFIPCVGIIFAILVYVALAERFGQGAGFAVGLVLLPFIFFPILGFGSAQYQPAPAAGAAPSV